MNTFHAIIFLHVTGAIALFVAWALEYNQIMIIKQLTGAAGNSTLKELKKNKQNIYVGDDHYTGYRNMVDGRILGPGVMDDDGIFFFIADHIYRNIF